MTWIIDTKSRLPAKLAAGLAISALLAIGTFALPAEARDASQQNLPYGYGGYGGGYYVPPPPAYGWPYGYGYYGPPQGYYGAPQGYYGPPQGYYGAPYGYYGRPYYAPSAFYYRGIGSRGAVVSGP
jgi:hypothetical protein